MWLRLNDENILFYKRNRPFRFEVVWLKHEGCEGVIKNAWLRPNLGDQMQRVMGKIDACSLSLRSWSQLSFSNIRRMLEKKKKQLIQVEALSMRGGNQEHVWILKGEVYELMVKENCMQHQRSMVDWLRSGDMNTTYFHSRATQRNK